MESMINPIDSSSVAENPAGPGSVEMPQATAWPFVLALGIALLGVGFVTSPVLLIVGCCRVSDTFTNHELSPRCVLSRSLRNQAR